MKIFLYFFVFLILLFLQVTILPFFSVGNLVPDVVLLGVVILGVREGGVPAMVTASIIGFVRDAFTTHFLGLSMLSLIIAAFLAGVVARNNSRLGLQGKLIAFFLVILISSFVYYFIYLFGAQQGILRVAGLYALPAALYTFIIGVIAHFVAPSGLLGR